MKSFKSTASSPDASDIKGILSLEETRYKNMDKERKLIWNF
jgi:hypothetical protein